MIEQWQLVRLIDKLKDRTAIKSMYLLWVDGAYRHCTNRGRVTYAMHSDEIDSFIRSTQMKANVAYKSDEGYILILYSEYSRHQEELHRVVSRIISAEPNFKLEQLWEIAQW